MAEELIRKFGYAGIALILVLGGLGLPIPEEAPIILAAILSRNGQMAAPLALASCLAGVLLGDFVVYLLGYWYGEKVLSLPLTRRLLTRQREAQITGYFHRHGFKILVSGRFVPGFRTAAYLTAGILKLPALKLLITDLVAATLSTLLMFGLGFLFAYQIQKGIHEVQQWITVIVAVAVAGWLLYRYYRARRRAGLRVGPPVLDVDEVALPSLGRPPSPGVAEGGEARSTAGSAPIAAPPTEDPGRCGPPAEPAAPAEADPTRERPGIATDGGVPSRPGLDAARPESAVGIDLGTPSPSPSIQSPSR